MKCNRCEDEATQSIIWDPNLYPKYYREFINPNMVIFNVCGKGTCIPIQDNEVDCRQTNINEFIGRVEYEFIKDGKKTKLKLKD